MKRVIHYSLLIVALAAAACKKGDEANPGETPVSSLISSVTLSSQTLSGGGWETGVYFTVSKPGKITQLGAKMPEVGTYNVTLWDAATKTVLRQKAIEIGTPEKQVFLSIDPLVITDKTKQYVISMNNYSAGVPKKYYYLTGSATLMPAAQGNILLLKKGNMSLSSETPKFPSNELITNAISGYPDFTFVPD
ncbi:DUF4082 domain-containing protein [Siphonobacter aquaeclarae]|uniref:Uncharacterized protein n=1 Tax=Siphonobacter aquaeclarae TaxID=563176 RepID=A0A1G9T4E8_9BACT|nr:DUF4082 domain-containing protein [Siphonobacter aquaeclarae]SDM42506.1 protein of unknown function [Siphonobacter aquaeclarae]